MATEITACNVRTTIPITTSIHTEVILCHKCTSAPMLIPFPVCGLCQDGGANLEEEKGWEIFHRKYM